MFALWVFQILMDDFTKRLSKDHAATASPLFMNPQEPAAYIDIVYIDHASWLQTILLFVGGMEVAPNQAVVSSDGLVGRLVVASSPYAKVQLLTDRLATVGGMISRTRRQGIVRGAEGGLLSLDFVPLRSDVRVGDEIVTAGIDGIYPRGVPVGRVATVEAGDELFYRIKVTPAVEFARLDQAYVLGAERLPRELKEAPLDARP